MEMRIQDTFAPVYHNSGTAQRQYYNKTRLIDKTFNKTFFENKISKIAQKQHFNFVV